MERKRWARRSQERAVEKLYGRGVERYDEFHNGYLNFGLWEEGITDYVQAAENLVRRLGQLLGLKPGSRLLDAACGMGPQDIYFFQRFGPLEIDAVDVTWKHLAHAVRRARQNHCQEFVRFRHASATCLPFADGVFTHAVSVEGAEHFDTREAFFREAFRVLAPGGVLALSDYALKREPRNLREKMLVEAARSLWKMPRENVHSTEGFADKLRSTGFRNISTQEVGALTIPGYYFEQRRPECRRELRRIRGFVGGRLGQILDVVVSKAYRMGLAEYVLVRAEKPAAQGALGNSYTA